MGYTFDASGSKTETAFRHHQHHLAGRPVEDRRCCHLERRHLRFRKTNPDLLRAPATLLRGTAIPVRATTCSRSTVAIDADTGQIAWLSEHPE